MEHRHLALFSAVVCASVLSAPMASQGGQIPPSAQYYFTTNTVQAGDLAGCGSIFLADWTDPDSSRFQRVGQGGRFLVGLITYRNFECFGNPSQLSGQFSINAYFQEPVYETIVDPVGCAPFLSCEVEVAREIVFQDLELLYPFQVTLTSNTTGDPVADGDGLYFPNGDRAFWVPENASASFFFTAEYQSPLSLFSLIPADDIGWVTAGQDPTGQRITPSAEDLAILALAGAAVTVVPEPATLGLFAAAMLGLVLCRRLGNRGPAER